jgi:NAD(P)-dependent dehydrogenase (short-subunit alcohol dehydrogenase family)
MIAPDATWLVTGASAGFGREIVRAAAARGARVIATARNPDDVADLASDRVVAARLDVTRPETIAPLLERFGPVDVLVNNAGYGLMATVEEATEAEVQRQFATNLFGPAALVRAVLPAMRRRRSGLVINVSSTAGSRGLPGSGYYSASKAALEMLTEALALEVADLGLRAMIVAPGPFRTDFFSRSIDAPTAGLADYAPIAAQRAAWLALDGAQRGDPVRGAAMIVAAALSADPPARLLLGGQAVASAGGACRARLAQIERCADTAPLADFPEGE